MSEYTSTIFKLPVSRYFIITIGSDRDNGFVLQDMDFYFQNVCNNLFVCILCTLVFGLPEHLCEGVNFKFLLRSEIEL